MDKGMENAMVGAIHTAELRTGRKFDFDTIADVLIYSARKLKAIGKGTDYLPLLFENELRDHVMREEINMIGALVTPETV